MVQAYPQQALGSIKAELKYLTPINPNEKLYFIVNPADVPEGEGRENSTSETFEFTINDIRGTEEEFNLSKNGFQVLRTPETIARVGDGSESRVEWKNDGWVKDVYYQEVDQLLKQRLGATRIHIFDHTIRIQDETGTVPDTPQSRQPVLRVHIDQTPESAIARVHRHLGEDAQELLKKRFALINVWRPLRGPVQDAPLAVADYRSIVKAKDLKPLELRREPHESNGETYAVLHNPQHKWHYLSNIQPDEALLLKCHDSDDSNGNATFAPHTAFYDPRFKGKVPPRQSIEIRALVFF